MKVLAIGDVVGSIGCKFLRTQLPTLKKEKNIDLVIANGENSADGNGITPASAEYLFTSGVDVITTGNHTFRRKESYELFDSEDCLLRPANYPKGAPGKGICIVDKGRYQIAVVNLMGVVYLEALDCPFSVMESQSLMTPVLGAKIGGIPELIFTQKLPEKKVGLPMHMTAPSLPFLAHIHMCKQQMNIYFLKEQVSSPTLE